jgi:hypothetical protein
MTTIILITFIVWNYIGSFGYIRVINQHKKEYRIKWRRREVRLVPLFGLLGPFAYIAGKIMRKPKVNLDEGAVNRDF